MSLYDFFESIGVAVGFPPNIAMQVVQKNPRQDNIFNFENLYWSPDLTNAMNKVKSKIAIQTFDLKGETICYTFCWQKSSWEIPEWFDKNIQIHSFFCFY